MNISIELEKLGELHRSGVLSDEEFTRAKAGVLNGTGSPRGHQAPAVEALNALRRSRDERWLGGVCGGIGQMTGLATWAWRLIFVLLAMVGGAGLVLYALLWILLPEQEAVAHRSDTGAGSGSGSNGNLHAGTP